MRLAPLLARLRAISTPIPAVIVSSSSAAVVSYRTPRCSGHEGNLSLQDTLTGAAAQVCRDGPCMLRSRHVGFTFASIFVEWATVLRRAGLISSS